MVAQVNARSRLIILGFVAALAVGGIGSAITVDRKPPFTYISGSFPAGFAAPDTDADLDLWINFHRVDCWMDLTRSFEDSKGVLFKEDKVVTLGPPPAPGPRLSSRPVHIPKRMAPGRGRYLPYAYLHCPGKNFVESIVNTIKPIYIGPPKFDIPITIVLKD